MTKEQKARALTTEALELNLLIGRSWTRVAAIYREVIDEGLWEVDFQSFAAWLKKVGDKGESQAYNMAKTYRELAETIPEPALAKMTLSNARDLCEVPASKRTASDVKAATEQTNNEYRRTLNHAHPGISLEPRTYKSFQFEESQLELVKEAIALARENNEIGTDGGAIEYICQQFLAAEGNTPHYRAAQIVTTVIQKFIDGDDLARPPDAVGWGTILGVVENMAKVFGFKLRTMKPAAPPRTGRAGERATVQ